VLTCDDNDYDVALDSRHQEEFWLWLWTGCTLLFAIVSSVRVNRLGLLCANVRVGSEGLI